MLASLLLLGACASEAAPADSARGSSDDSDGDGYPYEQDCDDADPARWEAGGVFGGDLDASQLTGFCDGFCDRSVIGSLDLSDASWFQVAELGCLSSIGGTLYLENNNTLTDLLGLEGLTGIEFGLSIYNNSALESLAGLSNLSSLGTVLALYNNDQLSDLSALKGLSSVGDLSIEGNSSLTDLSGLSSLTTIGHTFSLMSNARLTDLSGLYGLTRVGSNLLISYNPCLEDAEAEALRDEIGEENIGGEIRITENGGGSGC